MKTTRTGFSVAAIAAAILLLLQTVHFASAQDYDRDDPPTRAGRIGFVEGSVSFQPGGQGDWVEAVPNRPLTVGDNLWVDRDSRAEIQLGSTSIRLGPETSLSFLDVGNNVTQLRLSMGSLFFRVRRYGRDDTFEVDTPNLAFNVNRPGEFRLNVNGNGDQTIATVWRGEAEITGAGNSYRLMEGQQGTFSGADQLSYDIGEIGSPDSFSRWAISRDEREDRARSRHYVSEEMTGYEDLDDYGRWHEVGGYGNVWTPTRVPGDWAPYRYGHWVWVSPWGWTWVEEEPWGFAPFHYGRWAFVESSWCWVPGPVAVAPVYSPALVAFVGGGGFSIGVGVGGGVGWFPLGPGEVFVPWYRTSPRYVQNVNVTNTNVNVTQVTNVYNNVSVNHVTNVTYVNQRVTNSVTVVNHDTFVNARPVHNNIVRVDARQIASAPVTHEEVRNIQPARESVMGTARPAQVRPPEQTIARPVVATRQPVAMNRPAPVAGMERTAAPPPIRAVHAAPAAEAQPLERGARGTGGRPTNEAAPRPGASENNRPGAPAGNPPTAAPRPGAPENRPNAPENRPNAPENRPGAAPRPNGPENRPGEAPRSNGPENRPGEAPRSNAPENNRPAPGNNRGVPRPGAPETAPRPNAPENNRPEAAPRNEAPRPGAPRPNAPENRPAPPENNRGAQPENRPAPPENNRGAQPENRSAPAENNRREQQVPRPPSANRPEQAPEQPRQMPNARPEQTPEQPRQAPNARPESRRPEETPSTRPQQPARPPESRQEAAPRNENRPEAAPRQNENRPQAAPQPERNAPRPEARPSEPPPQRESRPQEQRNERKNPPEDKNKDKDKPPPQKFR